MTRDEVLNRLRAHEGELREAGLGALYLFGSVARGEAGADSDVDLAFDIGNISSFSLLSQVRAEDKLADIVGAKVDLVARAALRPRIRARVEAELVQVY